MNKGRHQAIDAESTRGPVLRVALRLDPAVDAEPPAPNQVLDVELLRDHRLRAHSAKHLVAVDSQDAARMTQCFPGEDIRILPEIRDAVDRLQLRTYIEDATQGEDVRTDILQILEDLKPFVRRGPSQSRLFNAVSAYHRHLVKMGDHETEPEVWKHQWAANPGDAVQDAVARLDQALLSHGLDPRALDATYLSTATRLLTGAAVHPRHVLTRGRDRHLDRDVVKRIFCDDAGLLGFVRLSNGRGFLATCFPGEIPGRLKALDASEQVRDHLTFLGAARKSIVRLYDPETWVQPAGPICNAATPGAVMATSTEALGLVGLAALHRAEYMLDRIRNRNLRHARQQLWFGLLVSLERLRLVVRRMDQSDAEAFRDAQPALGRGYTEVDAAVRDLVRRSPDQAPELLALADQAFGDRFEMVERIDDPFRVSLSSDQVRWDREFAFLTLCDVEMAARTLRRLWPETPRGPQGASPWTSDVIPKVLHPFSVEVRERSQTQDLGAFGGRVGPDLGQGLASLLFGADAEEVGRWREMPFWRQP